jgi:putative transcriptional regulator
MKRKNVAGELVEAMREAAAIAQGEAEPAAVHDFPLPLDVDVRAVRAATGLSRTEFARRFALDPRALQDWEQGRRRPDRAARAYLTVIARHPEAVAESLASWMPDRARCQVRIPGPGRTGTSGDRHPAGASGQNSC